MPAKKASGRLSILLIGAVKFRKVSCIFNRLLLKEKNSSKGGVSSPSVSVRLAIKNVGIDLNGNSL